MSEEGSEIVSTVPAQGPIVLVVFPLLQLAFVSHVRTMGLGAASEGMRRGGLFGGDEDKARAYASRLLDSSVRVTRDHETVVDHESNVDVNVLTVTVYTRLPLVGGPGPRWLTVRECAPVKEPQTSGATPASNSWGSWSSS